MKRALPLLLLTIAAGGLPCLGSAASRSTDVAQSRPAVASDQVEAAAARAARAKAAEQAQGARIAQARERLVAMAAVIARIARRPPALALADRASIADAAHLSVLIRQIQERIAVQNRIVARESARRTALHANTLRAEADLDAARRTPGIRQELAQASPDGGGLPMIGSPRDRILFERLAGFPGPILPPELPAIRPEKTGKGLYRLPGFGRVAIGTGEHDADGVRARGLTLVTEPGESVLAPANGRVRYAGPFRNYGDIVIIDHGHGWTSLVAGMARASAELGTDLPQGASIGRSGRRLLIELRHDGRPVDIVAMATALAS